MKFCCFCFLLLRLFSAVFFASTAAASFLVPLLLCFVLAASFQILRLAFSKLLPSFLFILFGSLPFQFLRLLFFCFFPPKQLLSFSFFRGPPFHLFLVVDCSTSWTLSLFIIFIIMIYFKIHLFPFIYSKSLLHVFRIICTKDWIYQFPPGTPMSWFK